jgi:histidyl-tRNA synthetase
VGLTAKVCLIPCQVLENFTRNRFGTRKRFFENWSESLVLCGFEEYDCAVLEPLELYIEKSGEEIVEQLVSFRRQRGSQVALRPEMTPTLARMVGAKANALRKPVKWFNIGDHFRYERMQKGRTRCFTQLNVDVLGEPGVIADVEAIYSLILVFKRLGLTKDQVYVRLSDRNLWLLAFEALGVPEASIQPLLGIIDKMDRMKEDALLASLEKHMGTDARDFLDSVAAFASLRSIDAIQTWFSEHGSDKVNLIKGVTSRLEEWKELVASLDQLGCHDFYEVDLSIVRGLAYYTGFVFEAFERGRRSRALAGGGRYDDLVKKLGGPDFPAVGWAMGDVTLLDCLSANNLMPEPRAKAKAFMIVDDTTRPMALQDLAMLREAGASVLVSYKRSGFGKQLKEANQNGCRYALIYGEEVVKEATVVVKDLEEGSSESIARSDIPAFLRKHS